MKLDIQSSEPTDKYIIEQTPKEYRCIANSLPGSKVLDIGAHIGCFSLMALQLGASQVVSVEPVPVSAMHLRRNLASAREKSIAIVIEAAVVGGDEETVTLRWLNTTWRSQPPKDQRTEWRGRKYQFATARTVRFVDLLEVYKPNVIKLDCEGAEYDILQSVDAMPDSVHTFTAEWHSFTPDAPERYQDCINRLFSWGFKPDNEIQTKFNSWGNFIRPIAWRR
jgi:FkbM family methyltransferase